MIIVLYGADTYRSSKKLADVRDRFIRDVDPSRLNIEMIDSIKLSVAKIQSAVRSVPFLSKRRLIIFKDVLNDGSKDFLDGLYMVLEEYRLHYHEDRSNILVFFESGLSLGRSKVAKLLKDGKFTQEFKPLEGFALNKWVRNEIRERNGKIDDAGIKALISIVGDDLWILHNEIDKLIAYAGAEKIVAEMVDLLTVGKFDDTIFALIDNLSLKNTAQSLILLGKHLDGGAHPLYILTMLVRQFRILICAKEMALMGKTKKEISLSLGIHPFVAQKSLQQSTGYELNELFSIYGRLCELDVKFKRGMIKEYGAVLLERFVLSVSL